MKGNKIHYFILKDKKLKYLCNQEYYANKDNITNDFHQITCKNCKKMMIKEDLLKIPVRKRTEYMHLILIKHFGGVREYLLSMGDFKDVPIED